MAYDGIESYLPNEKQLVTIELTRFADRLTTCNVPQGSICSKLIFFKRVLIKLIQMYES